MPWWHFEDWNPFVFRPVLQRQCVKYVGGPFDGRVEIRTELEPLISLPVTWEEIDQDHAAEGNPEIVVTSIASYVLYSREGFWVYEFARSKSPSPRTPRRPTE